MDYRKIWIGCLAAYNSGILHGEWIDSEYMTLDELQDEANRVLSESPIANAEEPFIADHEGYEGLLDGEPSLSEVADAEEAIGLLGTYVDADTIEAFGAFYEDRYCGDGRVYVVADFEDAFAGIWDSRRAYGEDLADELMECHADVPDMIARYFDYDAFTHDLFIDDQWAHELSTGGVAVFHNA